MLGPYQLSLLFLIFGPSVFALFDLFRSKLKLQQKTIWVFVLLITGILGALSYLFFGRDKNDRSKPI
jgi:uncharacterized membrane protein YiaA